MTRTTANQKGMTLLEVIVAVGVMALLMTVVVRIINSSLRSVQGGHAIMRSQADSSTALDYMLNKIEQAENICAPTPGSSAAAITIIVSPVFFTRTSGPYKEKARFRVGYAGELDVPPAPSQGRKIIIQETCRQYVNGQNEKRSMLVSFLSEIDEQKLGEPDLSDTEFTYVDSESKPRVDVNITMGLLQKPFQTDAISATQQGPWIKYHTYAGSVTPENISDEDACSAYRTTWCAGF